MDLEAIKLKVQTAIEPIKPGVPDRYIGRRTKASNALPEQFLVYLLLVDLLGFSYSGKGEKIAWSIPIDMNGDVLTIEFRKFGLGIFASPDPDYEDIAEEAVRLLSKGVHAAQPYFEWRAEQTVRLSEVNVKNKSVDLFDRYEFLLGLYRAKLAEAQDNVGKIVTDGASTRFPIYQLGRETEWLALAVIESFFSWTEHVFIHLAILQGSHTTGESVVQLAGSKWHAKFKASLDISEPVTKGYYDRLIEIRRQIRNFVAHGAFGKNGEAFLFHSGAGAVPVMLPHRRVGYSDRFRNAIEFLTSDRQFPDDEAIRLIQKFINFIRSGHLTTAWVFLDRRFDTILTEAQDGDYQVAMSSEDAMRSYVEYRSYLEDMYANMDF